MKCTLCGAEIRGTYFIDEWQQAICACHKAEQCSSCGRFVKPTDFHLADGRCLCSFCKPSVVSLPQHIEWVNKRVRSILAAYGINDLPKDIPIQLVTPAEMAKLNHSGQINLYQPGLAQTAKTIGVFGSHCKHTIYIDVAERIAEFPGGMAAFKTYIQNKMEYPMIAIENGVQGRVVVSFIVEKDGSISNATVTRGVDPHLDKEALRIINAMPKWKPAIKGGNYVRFKTSLPINFKLN